MDSTRDQHVGTVFRGLLNDIKRRPEDAAKDLGITVEQINRIIAGNEKLSLELIEKACVTWPLNERDFFPIHDDCPSGIRIMRAAEGASSARIMARGGAPYYEYRDTVMSRVAPFRPEWIKELCVVDDNNPENPLVQWNNGHFMHQFTYFIGPVNFYYKNRSGEKKVAVMNTGDSMYISPFIPHTFTTRKNAQGELGLILALTYGDRIAGDAHRELGVLGPDLSSGFFGDFRSAEAASAALLCFFQNCLSMSDETLASAAEIPLSRFHSMRLGESLPTPDERLRLAAALNVNVRDIMPPESMDEGVVIKKQASTRSWEFPADVAHYFCRELAASNFLPNSKALEMEIRQSQFDAPDIRVGLHQYAYNIGSSDVIVHWSYQGKSFSDVLEPGDSVYCKPFLEHAFTGATGKMLVLRIGGHLGSDALRDLSAIGADYVGRVVRESSQWFNPEGKR